MGTEPNPEEARSESARRRVVVTGLGALTTLGVDLAISAAAVRSGRSAQFTALPSGVAEQSTAVAFVPESDLRAHFRIPKALKLCDRRTRFAVSAAAMAIADSGLASDAEPTAVGVVLGTSSSDPRPEELSRPFAGALGEAAVDDPRQFAERILSRLHPLWLLVELPNMASAHVAIQLGLEGPNSTVMTDWAAGAQAIGEGFRWIQNGEAIAVLAGGADVGTNALALRSYRESGLFSGTTTGDPLLGEGAAVLVLEEREHALARGARVYAEIVGYAAAAGLAAVPGSTVAPWTGIERALRGALAEAEWQTADIDCFVPGGVASATQRRLEKGALAALGRPPRRCFDPSPQTGHALAAQAPIALSLALATSLASDGMALEEHPPRLACTAMGFLEQSVALAVAGQRAATSDLTVEAYNS